MGITDLFKYKYYSLYNDSFWRNYNKYFPKHGKIVFYEIQALIALGDFDLAEALIYRLMEYSSDEKKYNLYYSLAIIYYHKREWIKFFMLVFPNIEANGRFNLDFIKSIVPTILTEGNSNMFPDGFMFSNGEFNYSADLHVLKNHSNDFNLDRHELLEVIRSNFDKARVYYAGFHQMRYFKCDCAGYDSDIYEKDKPRRRANYIKVISYNNDPNTIISFYPVFKEGDTESFDISSQFYQVRKNTKEI